MKASMAKRRRPMPMKKLRRCPYCHVFSKKIKMVNRIIQGRFIKPTTTITSGIVGAVLGVLGLLAAGFALVRKPKLAGVSGPETKTPAESLRG